MPNDGRPGLCQILAAIAGPEDRQKPLIVERDDWPSGAQRFKLHGAAPFLGGEMIFPIRCPCGGSGSRDRVAHLISEAVRWGTRIVRAELHALDLLKFVSPTSTPAVGGRTRWATRPRTKERNLPRYRHSERSDRRVLPAASHPAPVAVRFHSARRLPAAERYRPAGGV